MQFRSPNREDAGWPVCLPPFLSKNRYLALQAHRAASYVYLPITWTTPSRSVPLSLCV
jgi:hypothetical protein